MEDRIVWIKLNMCICISESSPNLSLHIQVTQFTVLYVTQITILCVTQFWCLCNTILSSVHACHNSFNHFEKKLFSHEKRHLFHSVMNYDHTDRFTVFSALRITCMTQELTFFVLMNTCILWGYSLDKVLEKVWKLFLKQWLASPTPVFVWIVFFFTVKRNHNTVVLNLITEILPVTGHMVEDGFNLRKFLGVVRKLICQKI